jgi:hypothetical protein
MYWFNYRAMFGASEKHSPTGLRSDMINYLRIYNDKRIIKWGDDVQFYNATDYGILGGTWRC